MPSFRGSSRPRDQTPISYVSCVGRLVLYHQWHLHLSLNLEFWSENQTFFPASNSEKKKISNKRTLMCWLCYQQRLFRGSLLLGLLLDFTTSLPHPLHPHLIPASPSQVEMDTGFFFVGLGHIQQSGLSACLVYQFVRAAITKCHKLGGSE